MTKGASTGEAHTFAASIVDEKQVSLGRAIVSNPASQTPLMFAQFVVGLSRQ